ncbi:MAG: WecB/TagA/CpsF family glycosyltransferase [bacterium]|nr:WecB/TagA/CpsF family glycosyltransferase [bacterium]
MHKKTDIMGVKVDLVSQDYLLNITNEYLSNSRLNVYFLLTTELCLKAQEDEAYRQYIEDADLVLPSEKHIVDMQEELAEEKNVVLSYNSLVTMAQRLKEEKSIFLLCENEDMVKRVTSYCKRKVPKFKIKGYYCYEDHLGDEQIVNVINGVTPDILISTLPSPLQEQWIMEYRTQVNAKLFVGMGGVLEAMIFEGKQPPKAIKKLHLEGLYEKFMGRKKDKALRARIFRKKVAQYNNKKGEDTNGSFK